MIKFFLLLLISWSALANPLDCDTETSVAPEVSALITASVEVSEKACHSQMNVEVLDIAVGCLSGGGKAVTGMIEGFVDIVKLLLVEAPAWVWGEAKEKISRLIDGDMDPSDMVSAIASINLSSQSDIWDKAKAYWKTFKTFAGEMKDKLTSEIKGFPCLPFKKQSEIICRGVSEIFLIAFSPAKFIQGAKWGVQTSKALKNFIAETKSLEGLEGTNLAQRLELAGKALKDSKGAQEIMRLQNGSLKEVTLPTGEKVLQYEYLAKGVDGKMHKIIKDVPVDGKTLAIDANSAIGKEIMSEAVKAQTGKGSLVFVDVNHLGKVNYFKNGTQGGDDYLESVAESLRKSIRPGDMVFKNGGDELVIVLGANDPLQVKSISQRMINEVDRNPKVRQIFRQEVVSITQQYREVNRASSLRDLSADFQKGLTLEEKLKAQENFTHFQAQKKLELKSALSEQARYRGSISVGSSTVKAGESVAEVLQRAEKQAAEVKVRYKAGFGHDVSKYNVQEIMVAPKRIPPVALEPI